MASKSFGQIAGTVIGAAVGFFAGGNVALGASIGGMIGGMIDPPKGPTVVGPRLDDLSFQTSTLGAPLGRAYGTVPVLGNVVWLEGDKYREVITSEDQGGKGGPTATTETAHYYATFAVSLLRVTDPTKTKALRRLWIGSNLVYDAGSDNIESIIASNSQSSLFSFYSGSDDQQPNTRWQADKGANAVSGFPGRCYIVIYDLDLEPYSRSLAMAQVKVELASGEVISMNLDTVHELTGTYGNGQLITTAILGKSGCQYSSIGYDYATQYAVSVSFNNDEYMASRDRVVSSLTDPGWSNPSKRLAVVDTDVPVVVMLDAIGTYGLTGRIRWYSSGGSMVESDIFSSSDFSTSVPWSVAVRGTDTFFAYYGGSYKIQKFSGVLIDVETTANYDVQYMGVSENFLFAVQYSATSTANTTIYKFDRLTLDLIDTYVQAVNGQVVKIKVVDDASFHTLHADGRVCRWEDGVITVDHGVMLDASVHSTVTATVWFNVFSDSPFVGVSLVGLVGTTPAPLYINMAHGVIPQEVAKLRDVVTAECALAGIDASEIDLTELTDADVRGYRIANAGSVRSSLEMLQAAYPFDVAPSGYKLRFVSRGGASLATIPETDLGAVAGGDSLPVLLPLSREMDTQIPYKVSVRYLDPSREYDIGEQYASRPDTASVSERTVELSLVLTGDEAAQVADVLNQKDWLERTSFGPFTLPPTWMELEPPDVVTVEHRGQAHELRLMRGETLPDGRIVCSGVPSRSQSYTSTATAQESLTIGQSLVPLKGSTQGYLLDIPRIRSEQDVFGMPFVLLGQASGWPGGVLLRSDDSGTTWQTIAATNTRAKVFTSTPALASHHGYSIDHGASLIVTPLYSSHALSSVTEEQFYSESNLAAYGADGRWEIVAFKTAIDNTGSYTLTDFLRGLYGTEWASGLHVAGDYLVMLDTSTVGFFGLPTNALNAPRLYRSVTQGTSIDSAADVSDTYEANNLKPLAPVDLSGERFPGTLDWNLDWKRRTRWPVDVFSGSTVPLAETSESYEVDIYSDGDFDTLKRTLTGLTSPVAVYTEAQQLEDFGTRRDTLYLKVFQVSSVVGRGFPLTSSIYRFQTTPADGYDDLVLSLSPSLYLKMDGSTTTFVDSSTTASNATGASAGITYSQPGILTGDYGYCVTLADGASQGYISAPHRAGFNGAFTVAMVLRPTSLSAPSKVIFHHGDYAVGGSQGWLVYFDTSGRVNFEIFSGSYQYVYGTVSVVSANSTARVTLTYDNATTVKIFKDGAYVETLTLPVALPDNSQNLIVGGYRQSTIYGRFIGKIDDFAWFDSVLSDANITALYNAS